ncbi:M4 family metallopeptidase [Vitiosangium sp. GDMCC 1.1324]|uniref:M4 family metallopeptidase n=1 Tax=Vitiosangium sp. (strain GDMCC 1.1324) TaxID=2138576 RepID=UPI00130DB7EA|nr:M4 family metallopeptidase [Vitiosangium sp. GDMCC 1.1324]
MKRFSAKFGLNSRMFLGLAAAGALSACGAEAPVNPGTDSEVGQQAIGRAEQDLSAHLEKAAAAIGATRAEFARKSFQRDDLAFEHTRFQQAYKGVPVVGGEAIVHYDPAGALQAITDDFRQGIQVDVTPRLNDAEAIARAVSLHGGFDKLTARPESQLVVLRHEGKDYLTYKVQLRQEDGSAETSMPVFFIDAKTGEKVFGYDNLQTAGATGTLKTLYSGSPAGTTFLSGTTYYLEDVTRKVGTFDMRNTTTSVYRFADADNIWGTNTTASTQSAGADAHFGAQKTYDYYLSVHNRNGIDGSGGPGYFASIDGVTPLISSVVHYSTGYNNAFWNGSYMTYGDGDGTTFSPLVTLDICGHEMTHGVTERTAALVYSGESGALNESMSDVFGAMVELYATGGAPTANTWKVGEASYTPATSGDALRYMDNPHAAPNRGYTTDDDPDHYTERYTGTSDNGGVHINSGIPNKVFYLVAVGGTHHYSGITVTGIGVTDAARIWYRALTSYMTSSTNFAGAKTATLNAAAAIFGLGSPQYNSVQAAWTAAGI